MFRLSLAAIWPFPSDRAFHCNLLPKDFRCNRLTVLDTAALILAAW